MTDENIYRLLYSARSGYGTYPSGSPRQDIVVNWLMKNLPPPATILDYGAGRGYVLRKLLAAGYDCRWFDTCTWLVENDLKDLVALKTEPAEVLSFLGIYFDCTVSCDVLEHLPTEQVALNLMRKLVHIARKFVIVTVGLTPCDSRSWLPKQPNVVLHNVVRPKEWWHAAFEDMCMLIEDKEIDGSYAMIGKKA